MDVQWVSTTRRGGYGTTGSGLASRWPRDPDSQRDSLKRRQTDGGGPYSCTQRWYPERLKKRNLRIQPRDSLSVLPRLTCYAGGGSIQSPSWHLFRQQRRRVANPGPRRGEIIAGRCYCAQGRPSPRLSDVISLGELMMVQPPVNQISASKELAHADTGVLTP